MQPCLRAASVPGFGNGSDSMYLQHYQGSGRPMPGLLPAARRLRKAGLDHFGAEVSAGLPAAASAIVVMGPAAVAVERLDQRPARHASEKRDSRVCRLLVCVGGLVGVGRLVSLVAL